MRTRRTATVAVAVLVGAVGVGAAVVPPAGAATTTAAAAGVRYDFEDGTNQGWGPLNNTVVTNDGSVVRTGTRSLAVHSLAPDAGAQVAVPVTGLRAGQSYRVSGYARGADGRPAARVRLHASVDGQPGAGRVALAGGAWNDAARLQSGFTWVAGARSLRLAVAVVGACGDLLPDPLYLDDITGHGRPGDRRPARHVVPGTRDHNHDDHNHDDHNDDDRPRVPTAGWCTPLRRGGRRASRPTWP